MTARLRSRKPGGVSGEKMVPELGVHAAGNRREEYNKMRNEQPTQSHNPLARRACLWVSVLVVLAAIPGKSNPVAPTASGGDGWIAVFDGSSLSGWHVA